MSDQPLLYPSAPNGARSETDEGRLVVVRHGTTAWSREGRHTGRTDVPLEEEGRRQAAEVGVRLEGHRFSLVLTSPLSRARDTCALAGFSDQVEICDDLMEWDYGSYEGMTTREIRERRPDWSLWAHGVVGGESIQQLAERADRVVARARAEEGDVLAFGHGHILRVVCARWVDLAPDEAARFALSPAGLGVLGWERETAVVQRWNDARPGPFT